MSTLKVNQAMRDLQDRYTAERPDMLCIDTPGCEAVCDHDHTPIERPAGVYPIQVTDRSTTSRRNVVVLVRFTRRRYGGWNVVRADNLRLLGWLFRPTTGEYAGRWEVHVADSAFRGTGPDDEGDLMDTVWPHLYNGVHGGHQSRTIAVESTREWGTRSLVYHLVREHAPAAGFGAHFGVTVWRTRSEQHFLLGEGVDEHCACGGPWPDCPKRAALLAAEVTS